ncbi:MAG: hypothetical protein AAFX87_00880 [Bacteroidota bacterium]
MIKKVIYIAILNMALGFGASAQNLESIGKEEKPLKVSGGASLNQVFYATDADGIRRDPYTFVLSGSLNFSLYGWSVPISYTLSNQNSSFQQPFNQYGIHPQYKSVTAHIGYSSMNFSPYTLNGHIFLGTGVEIEPEGKLKVSAMYGRLLKAVEPDTTSENADIPAFRRRGYGLKLTYGEGGDKVDVILFRSRDEINSIDFVPESQEVLPEENLVLSIGGEKTLFKRFKVSAEYAGSALTRDIRAEERSGDPDNIFSFVGGLYTQRESSSYFNAFKSSFQYTAEKYGLGINYERIDPGYETHGAYFFNNDLENVTVNFNTRLWKNRANLATNAGLQRNNLDNDKISEMERFVGSVNLGVVPSERVNVNLSYSSFQSFTNIRSQFDFINQLTPFENFDTLNYRQINHSANANVSYFLSKPGAENRKMLTTSLSYNRSNDEQGSTENITNFYNANLAFNTNFKQSGLGLTVSVNATQSSLETSESFTFGPNVALSKAFLEKKLTTSAALSYNASFVNGDQTGEIINFRLNGGYRVGKKHNLNLSLFMLRNNAQTVNIDPFNEFTANMGYAYRF